MVHPRGHPLHSAVIGIRTQIKFHGFGVNLVHQAFPGQNDALGNVVTRKDVLPNTLGQLVSPVGTAAALTDNRFKKQASACAPESFLVAGLRHLDARRLSR